MYNVTEQHILLPPLVQHYNHLELINTDID